MRRPQTLRYTNINFLLFFLFFVARFIIKELPVDAGDDNARKWLIYRGDAGGHGEDKPNGRHGIIAQRRLVAGGGWPLCGACAAPIDAHAQRRITCCCCRIVALRRGGGRWDDGGGAAQKYDN